MRGSRYTIAKCRQRFVVVVALTSFFSCTENKKDPSEKALLIFTPASLETALRSFVKTHKLTAELHVASSSSLAKQIVAGLKADVVLSAHIEWMYYLRKRNRIGRHQAFLGNRLAVLVHKSTQVGFGNLQGLIDQTQLHPIAIGDPSHVPIGRYAKQALITQGLWTRAQKRIIPTIDASAAVQLVAKGHAKASISYASDQFLSTKLKTAITIPNNLHTKIRYYVALCNSSPKNNKFKSKDFIQKLEQAAKTGFFDTYGFARLSQEMQRTPDRRIR